AEIDYVQARISGDLAVPSEAKPVPELGDYDYIFEEWMKILNAKLDTIVQLMSLQREGYFGLSYKALNISGSGLSFSVSDPLALGDILEIKIMLPLLHKPLALCIYGEVVKIEKKDGNYQIAVRYIHMDDIVRDEIVHFVFEREREIIREKRG
ncbi:MAG: PilZ domain-containing protein, partial [Deltaproteobacteria bacterium]|nr:PilZ domain-containing protein [Deltaproteobacteria bacterium]